MGSLSFQSLRFGGYEPRTLLGIGAGAKAFAEAFLKEFPTCAPTLVEEASSGLEGKTFDFVRIDAQGEEPDISADGVQMARGADYILVAVQAHARLGKLFDQLKEIGFRCADMGYLQNQGGILFERVVMRATQSNRYANSDRTPVLDYLIARKAACPDFSVLDVGASAKPWAGDVLNATFDLGDCSAAPVHFTGNFNNVRDWEPLLAYVAEHGKFSYCVCTHTLEDLANPLLTVEMLPRVAEAGFISTPSKYLELIRPEGPWRGFIHHRWIFCVSRGEIVLVPKIPLIEFMVFEKEKEWAQNQDIREVQIFWRKNLRMSILNNDGLGPNAGAVFEMYTSILNE